MKLLDSEMLNGDPPFNISASVPHFGDRKPLQRQLQFLRRALVLLVVLAAAVSCAKGPVRSGVNFDDATITARVKTAFVNDPAMGIQKIDVETVNGVVTLSGRVETKETEQKAIELARKVRGVSDVKSQIQVGGSTTPQS